eukprot:SAG22_NODE_256_length_13561_cov_3.225524_3_plen_198_part_00
MLGDFDMEMMTAGHDSMQKWTIIGFFFLFTLIISIVLFNAVIAIMGEKYAEAQEEQQKRPGFGRLERAHKILEYEAKHSIYSINKDHPEWVPKYLHVLKPRASSEDDDEDGGIPSWAEKANDKLSQQLKDHIQASQRELATIKGQLKAARRERGKRSDSRLGKGSADDATSSRAASLADGSSQADLDLDAELQASAQ